MIDLIIKKIVIIIINLNSIKAIESHEYHMKIVPTIYEDLSGNIANSFQYTYAYKSHIGIY
jgi:hypothetical protein